MRAGYVAAISLLVVACARDPEEALCPDIVAGDLVVTEVRGPQNPTDAINGEWVELYNASGRTVDLLGIRVRFRKKDGSGEIPIIVRDNVSVAAGEYTVLGLFLNDNTRPAHVNYGFAGDFKESWLAGAAIDVESCGVRIDRAVYDALPKMGTFAFTGAMQPDPNMNDDLRLWCTDGAMTGAVYPGTPQAANPACP